MAAAWRDASSEALNAFGDARVYLEKYIDRPRHVEIQIFGDAHGHIVLSRRARMFRAAAPPKSH